MMENKETLPVVTIQSKRYGEAILADARIKQNTAESRTDK